MLKPTAGEDKGSFVSRFVASKEAQRDFPDMAQCIATGLALWEDHVARGDKADGAVVRFDRGAIKSKVRRTAEGYLRVDQAVVTRTGVLTYRNPDGTERRELRHPDEVLTADSLESMKMIPVTNDHPWSVKLVNAKNAKQLAIGWVGETISHDGSFVSAPFSIVDDEGIKAIEGGRRELSLGYTTQLVREDGVWNGQRYDHRQTKIRYNHLAVVDTARVGSVARLHLDAADGVEVVSGSGPEDRDREKGKRMLEKVKLDGLEYEAAPEVVRALGKSTDSIKALEAKVAELSTKLDGVKAEATKAAAERDEVKERLDAVSKEDKSGQIAEAVKARRDLERNAEIVLDGEQLKKLPEMTDDQVRKAVIVARSPEAKLDGKDDLYIRARYDAAVEGLSHDPKAIADARKKTAARQDGSTNVDPVTDARAQMQKRMAEAYTK